MTKKQIVTNTLRWCNAQRRKKGKGPLIEMPKGHRKDPASCPCGAATKLLVYAEFAQDIDWNKGKLDVPASVREFIRLFDLGEFPEYDSDAA